MWTNKKRTFKILHRNVDTSYKETNWQTSEDENESVTIKELNTTLRRKENGKFRII
jgi:hypothetical protein